MADTNVVGELRKSGVLGWIALLFSLTGAGLLVLASVAALRGNVDAMQGIIGAATTAIGFVGALLARRPEAKEGEAE